MRPKRELAENVWYLINTSANNGELLFRSEFGGWLFGRTLSEAKERFAFELRGVRFAGATVSFFIKPADGLELPEIMKWIKQAFALRFNWDDGRSGHIRGMGRRPTEWAERVCLAGKNAPAYPVLDVGVCPRRALDAAAYPALDAGVCPRRVYRPIRPNPGGKPHRITK
jgi:hypothetical protein